MKALKEIKWRQTWRYLLFSPLLLLFKFLLYSPIRILFLRLMGASIGKDCVIHDVRFFNLYRGSFRHLQMGDKCFIGDECLLDLADRIIIEDDCTIAERVTILTHTNVGYSDHPLQREIPSFKAPVIMKKGSFVGINATILPGVTLGEYSAVAAGSLVNKSVPDKTLVGGVPAKVIRQFQHILN